MQQKARLEVKIKYVSGSFNYLHGDYKAAKKEFFFVLINGGLPLKAKALIKTLLIILKKGFKV